MSRKLKNETENTIDGVENEIVENETENKEEIIYTVKLMPANKAREYTVYDVTYKADGETKYKVNQAVIDTLTASGIKFDKIK